MAKATASGWIGRDTGNVTSHTTMSTYGASQGEIRRALNRGHGTRKLKAVLLALTGAAVGAASKAYSTARVDTGVSTGQAGRNDLGGRRTTSLVTLQSGVTVAADLTNVDQSIAAKSRLSSYPADKGGFAPGNINKL